MPSNLVKTEREERLWAKAKGRVKEQYPDVKADSDSYWKLVNGIYQRMKGDKKARAWTPEGRVLSLDTHISEAAQHLLYLKREAPWAAQVIDRATKLVEQAAEVIGRDLAREMSLPMTRAASDSPEDALLRHKLVRLAHTKPHLREAIQALLDDTTGTSGKTAEMVWETGQMDDEGKWAPGKRVLWAPLGDGVGSQVPPARNRDGEILDEKS